MNVHEGHELTVVSAVVVYCGACKTCLTQDEIPAAVPELAEENRRRNAETAPS